MSDNEELDPVVEEEVPDEPKVFLTQAQIVEGLSLLQKTASKIIYLANYLLKMATRTLMQC
jgi:hypothetical protein